MSLAPFEEERPSETERDLRIRDLESTTMAMRSALELAQREADERLQAANVQAAAEAEQLRSTVTALRRELETRERDHGMAMQGQKQQSADEVAQLQATIRALREALEEHGG